ncbi:hypothetical protein JDV02_005116 [Purpureocillium takamizusanense]|uniref:phosphoribosylamine--glycine ligase n=1 Tax=Purpureocillium takamizusanense TaxID=2060973 RepID=A0A9Q8QF99_9HYPO|nr:uncharacterized protein JDV02_005116 [Purpureocillium takamizusanense]UNI18878.1 hypothetical protein JDV02_005116 [Purpureocillium takamizusanense]
MTVKALRVLLIGKGGREHAIAWKLSQSPSVAHVFVCPGNGGTARGRDNVSNIQAPAGSDYASLVSLANDLNIGLVVVGPDEDVVAGLEGFFRRGGIPCDAPTKEAAELEGSKTFAKDFMRRCGIPTAEYQNFDDVAAAKEYVRRVHHSVVIKASGLAAGKGVILPSTKEEACEALDEMVVHGRFGGAASSVVIEELLEGQEISILTFSDGITTLTLPPGQDHKRIFKGNLGPNTGGMGEYAPTPFVSGADLEEIERKILRPTFDGLRAEGREFRGLLFTGVMMTPAGPTVLEYNTRFGDPETQSVMLLLADDTDLAQVLLSCTNGTLGKTSVSIKTGFACNVVIAAGGYPGAYSSGDDIEIGAMPPDVVLFHAGTELVDDGKLKTAGGRVLSVAAHGRSLEDCVAAAYKGVNAVRFRDMYYREDIALQCLQGQ